MNVSNPSLPDSGGAAAELVVDARAELAEGPWWDAARQQLVWVEILGSRVHFFDPATGLDSHVDVGQPVGAAVPRAAGGLVLALRDGFAVLDPETAEVELLAPVERENTGNRMNDGKCDSRGRFWAGTMAFDSSTAAGALYRLDADHRAHKVLTGVTVSNGLDWSPDDGTMYFIDTPTRRVDAFDWNPEEGTIENRRSLVQLPGPGFPDGMTVDRDGFLWIAVWGEWAVRRYAPDGVLERVVCLPVEQVTSCGFGGCGLNDLYITSARKDLTPADLEAQPLAGGVFRVHTDVAGRGVNAFAG